MRFRIKTEEEKNKELSEWHDFFCVFPRKINDGKTLVFMETIERKCTGRDYEGLRIFAYRDKIVNVSEYIRKYHHNESGLQARLCLGEYATKTEIQDALKNA